MTHALLALALVAALPAAEDVSAALADARALPEGAAAQVRYLSLSTVAPTDRAEAAVAVSFALQHVSRSPVIVLPVRVSDRLLRLDLAAVAPVAEERVEWVAVWESLGAADPYYHLRTAVLAGAKEPTEVYTDGGWLDLEAAAELRKLTGSAVPILDARWWVAQALVPPVYYQLAGIPATKAEWYATLGVDPATIRDEYAHRGANLIRSGVTGKPRRLSRWPTPSGGVWNTYDVKRADGVHDPFRDPTFGGAFDYDAGEYIAARPNGFHEYFIADAQGQRVDVVDPFIATDTTLGLAGALQPAASCIRCHNAAETDSGLKPFADVQSRLLASGADLTAADPETAARLAQFYGRQDRLQREAARDREDYAEAVAQATGGLTPFAAAAAWARLDASYRAPFTADQACLELGLLPEPTAQAALGKVLRKSADPVSLMLCAGLAVDRGQWEASYPLAALAVAESTPKPAPNPSQRESDP